MKNLSKKELLFVSLMLFSLFFGAGNLIFPPFLGQSAGNNTWIAMAGFFITAVGFPVLGVVAVAKSGG
jgi:LIVCS family branched-chain amino acid:cation transporter